MLQGEKSLAWKTAIVVSEILVGFLLGCAPESAVILVIPFLFLWLATSALLYDFYQEHLMVTLRFDATIPISITVAVAPIFIGMVVCAEFRQ